MSKTLQVSKHRLYVPCRECGSRVAIDTSVEKGKAKCDCGWEVQYEIQ